MNINKLIYLKCIIIKYNYSDNILLFKEDFSLKRFNILWGLLLIAIGIIILANRVYGISFISMQLLWPLFILIPGLSFEFTYFIRRKDAALLILGGTLTTIGLLFLFQTNTYWRFSEITAPVCILAAAIGLFQFFFFGRRSKGLLIPIFIFGGIGIIGLLTVFFGELLPWLNYSLFLPLVLILIGLYVLLKSRL
jgi:hypothetical protein